jgi:hypothetical protein
MTPITKQLAEMDMETLTLDVRGIPDEKVHYLQQLVERWKEQAKQKKKSGRVIEFATHDSDVIGGEFKRANAYE